MKLNEVLDSLHAAKFFHDRTHIQIVVTKGKSLKKDDQIFDCYLPVDEARYFFGGLEVIVNKLETRGEYHIPTFWFLLACKENEK